MNDTKVDYKAKWDWKMSVLIVIGALVLQGCRTLLEMQNVVNFTSNLWMYAGIVVLLIGIIDAAIETYMGLGLFYGKSQHGGSNANAGIVCSIGIALTAKNFVISICLIVGVVLIVGAIRYFISSKQCEKANKYIGKIGVAQNNIAYKGKGKFDGEIVDVRITHDKIKKGDRIKIETMDGFHLIVEKI
nr:NfeD family protein [uncultured Sellimonas sp.]